MRDPTDQPPLDLRSLRDRIRGKNKPRDDELARVLAVLAADDERPADERGLLHWAALRLAGIVPAPSGRPPGARPDIEAIRRGVCVLRWEIVLARRYEFPDRPDAVHWWRLSSAQKRRWRGSMSTLSRWGIVKPTALHPAARAIVEQDADVSADTIDRNVLHAADWLLIGLDGFRNAVRDDTMRTKLLRGELKERLRLATGQRFR